MKTKSFDCVRMKREAQMKIREAVRGLSPDEELAYFRAGADEFEQRIEQAKESTGRCKEADVSDE